jgi:3-methyladenine DNA glycosylase AlkD
VTPIAADSARVAELLAAIDAVADPSAAQQMARYFQVRPGGYGEGDVFVGVQLSRLRRLVRPYVREPVSAYELGPLLDSPVHEHRLAGVVLLAEYAERALRRSDEGVRRAAYQVWGKHSGRINNWDLVDAGAGPVVGGFLLDRPRNDLYRLVESPSVWERRTALVATHRFIRAGQTADTYALARLVLSDTHPLIHKAAGWMLREAGKRVDEAELRGFLDQHADAMPRTMLRYAIERLTPAERLHYMRR